MYFAINFNKQYIKVITIGNKQHFWYSIDKTDMKIVNIFDVCVTMT